MSEYEDGMKDKAISLFREMVNKMNELLGTEMIDPLTRQRVGISDIPQVIIEQIEGFTDKWIKGSKDAKEREKESMDSMPSWESAPCWNKKKAKHAESCLPR